MAMRVAPFLMFTGQAEEAIRFYVATIPDSRLVTIEHYGEGGPGIEGSVMKAVFEISGLPVMCTDSPVPHDFTFTPSTSFFVTCQSEDEIQSLAEALGRGGEILMPLGDYGFSRRFVWLNDRFGVSWQLNLE